VGLAGSVLVTVCVMEVHTLDKILEIAVVNIRHKTVVVTSKMKMIATIIKTTVVFTKRHQVITVILVVQAAAA
jgi:hypothetical protein